MSRLIDADAAIDALKELTANGTNKGMVFGEDAVHRIEILPSEQPETNCSEIPNSSDTISRQLLGTNLAEVGTDCISRQQVIEPEAISKWKKGFREYVDSLDIARDDWKGIIEYIDELPSMQPERKTGRWLEMSSTNHTYKCSVCGRLLVNITDGKNNVAKNYPYCHCGADMRGEGVI